jgi:spermidine/putrescine transport system permease protein
VISMMGSYLVRMYSWRTLLGENGIINSLLESLGLISHPLGFLLFNRAAVVLAEVNYLMPFSALVFYAGLSGIPDDYREAARDLGTGRFQALRRVVLPLVGESLLGAAAFTFFLSCGDYITPVLLGGSNSTTFGTLISDQLRTTGNYPLGASLSFVLVACFILVYLLLRLVLRAGGLLPRKVENDAKA